MTEVDQAQNNLDEVKTDSVFKAYLETHPEALQTLFKAVT